MNIAEPSGRLMRWRIRLAELEFEVNYETGALNTQADALSRLPTEGEALPQPEGKEIPCFSLLGGSREFMPSNPNCYPTWNKGTYIDESSELHVLLLSTPVEDPVPGTFIPVTTEELVREQFGCLFRTKLRARLSGGETLPFRVNEVKCLV